mgnify:CR=1 FL=1
MWLFQLMNIPLMLSTRILFNYDIINFWRDLIVAMSVIKQDFDVVMMKVDLQHLFLHF